MGLFVAAIATIIVSLFLDWLLRTQRRWVRELRDRAKVRSAPITMVFPRIGERPVRIRRTSLISDVTVDKDTKALTALSDCYGETYCVNPDFGYGSFGYNLGGLWRIVKYKEQKEYRNSLDCVNYCNGLRRNIVWVDWMISNKEKVCFAIKYCYPSDTERAFRRRMGVLGSLLLSTLPGRPTGMVGSDNAGLYNLIMSEPVGCRLDWRPKYSHEVHGASIEWNRIRKRRELIEGDVAKGKLIRVLGS